MTSTHDSAAAPTPAVSPTHPAYDPARDSPFAQLLRIRIRLDVVLVVLVIVLALARTATPISNSDIWLHLANGRHVVQQPSEFGTLPSVDPAEPRSANPSWLFDLLCYGVYTLAGGFGLAALRSLLVVLLTVTLLRAGRVSVGRVSAGWWVPVLTTGAALLVLTPRLQLQPLLLSLLLFAWTLSWLERQSWQSPVPLCLLFLVWVNVDRGFVFGLFAVAVYWLAGLAGRASTRGRVPATLLLAVCLVCLVNPAGYHAFRLPADLAWPAQHPTLGGDPLFAPLYASPWPVGIRQAALLRTTEGLALSALIVAAAVALLVRANQPNRSIMVAAPIIVLVCTLGLWLYQSRQAPLLAVTAAILGARALQQAATAYFADRPGSELRLRQACVGRFGTIAALLAIVVLAGLGRLQPANAAAEGRGWGLEPEPSLVLAAETLQRWRVDGRLPAHARGLNTAPDVANYLAWFAPQEPGFFNGRLDVSPQVADDFAEVRAGLVEPTSAAAAVTCREVLRRRQVSYLIVSERDTGRLQAMLNQFAAAGDEWRILLQAGRVLVLAWHDPQATGPGLDLGPALDLKTLGMHPTAAEQLPPSPEAPPKPAWWRDLVPWAQPPSLARDEAALALMLFDALVPPTARANARQWELACITGSAGAALTGGLAITLDWLPNGPDTRARRWARQQQLEYVSSRDDAPPGLLWSAIRAARHASTQQPDQADAYLLLGEAYARLGANTGERADSVRLPRLLQLHKLQAIHALHQAIRLRPDLEQAQLRLAALYEDSRYLDLAWRHLAAFVRAQAEHGPRPGEPRGPFEDRLNGLRKLTADLEGKVAQRQDVFEQKSAGLSVAARARLADQLGLAATALDVLLNSDIAAFGHDGLLIELELLLVAGRADEARRWLDPSHEAALGEVDYRWLAARLAALAGDYAAADLHLRQLMSEAAPVPELGGKLTDPGPALAVTVAANLLIVARRAVQPMPIARFEVLDQEALVRLLVLGQSVERTAEMALLRAALALEQGDSEAAESDLHTALRLAAPHGQPVRPLALYFRDLLAQPPNRPEAVR